MTLLAILHVNYIKKDDTRRNETEVNSPPRFIQNKKSGMHRFFLFVLEQIPYFF